MIRAVRVEKPRQREEKELRHPEGAQVELELFQASPAATRDQEIIGLIIYPIWSRNTLGFLRRLWGRRRPLEHPAQSAATVTQYHSRCSQQIDGWNATMICVTFTRQTLIPADGKERNTRVQRTDSQRLITNGGDEL